MCGRTSCNLSRETVKASASGVAGCGKWKDRPPHAAGTSSTGSTGSGSDNNSSNSSSIARGDAASLDNYLPAYNKCPGESFPVMYCPSSSSPTTSATTAGEDPSSSPSTSSCCWSVRAMTWGLVPSFTRPDVKPEFFRMFNARTDSIYERASFSRLMTNRRCIAFVDGYYEWKTDLATGKQPHFVAPADGAGPMRLACVYDTWQAQGAVEPLYTFSVLTRDADTSIAWLHDRQPVFLQSDDAAAIWLDPSSTRADLQGIFDAHAPDLKVHAVTKKMSSMGFQGPECIQPVKASTQTALSFEKRAAGGLSSPMKTSATTNPTTTATTTASVTTASSSLSSPVRSPSKVLGSPPSKATGAAASATAKRKVGAITNFFSSVPSPSKKP